MKKVKDTKNPTIKQMSSMSENLREKFNKYSSIDLSVGTYTYTKLAKLKCSIYVENKHCIEFEFWQELLSFYHKLMEKV